MKKSVGREGVNISPTRSTTQRSRQVDADGSFGDSEAGADAG